VPLNSVSVGELALKRRTEGWKKMHCISSNVSKLYMLKLTKMECSVSYILICKAL
jgi:hypothetical protein